MPAQKQFSLNNMSLIITIILWGIVHGGGAPCTVNGVAGYRFGSAPCVAFKVTPTPKQLLFQMQDNTIHTLGIAEHVEMNIAGGGKKEWVISGITSGGASFENSGTTKTLTATDISKSLSAAGHTAHMSAYNRFDYYSGYDDDYEAYDGVYLQCVYGVL